MRRIWSEIFIKPENNTVLMDLLHSTGQDLQLRNEGAKIRRCPITLLFSKSAWVLLHPAELSTFKELWDGTSGLSSLSEKTRKSNHLQMKLQKQHFSPQLFKDPECWSGRSLELTTSRITARCTTKWATRTALFCNFTINETMEHYNNYFPIVYKHKNNVKLPWFCNHPST